MKTALIIVSICFLFTGYLIGVYDAPCPTCACPPDTCPSEDMLVMGNLTDFDGASHEGMAIIPEGYFNDPDALWWTEEQWNKTVERFGFNYSDNL